jgi:hypothetical protein
VQALLGHADLKPTSILFRSSAATVLETGQAKLAVRNGRTSPNAPQDYIDRRPTRMEAVATKTAGFALFFSITS